MVNCYLIMRGDRELFKPDHCLIIGEVAQAHDGSLGMAHAFIDAIAAAGKNAEAGPALAALAAARMPVVGAFKSADVAGARAFLRYEGVKGASDVSVDLRTGAATARIHRADMLTIMDDLHRGKNVGKAWQWVIDISGAVFLVLSLVGYVLFFTLRFRLKVALALTAFSLGSLGLIFLIWVP